MSEAVRVDSVTAAYRDMPVLSEISFAAEVGDMLGIIGPNGSGKTTLLRVLSGLQPTLSGSVQLHGRDIQSISASERARIIAVVPQEILMPVAFTVGQLVMIGRTAALSRWHHPSKKDYDLAEKAMVCTDVADLRDKRITELSGGEKQRAVIAMALAQEPKVILLDEVTSHLDINHRLEVMRIIEQLNEQQGITVLLTSHDLNLAAEYCQRLIVLDNGKLVANGTPTETLTEELLQRVYHCDVRVHREPDTGRTHVLPLHRITGPRPDHGARRVHVIAGGGSGEEIMRRLHLCGYSISCGVLNRGDTDAQTALALGIETVLERPFSPISEAASQAAAALAGRADTVILCAVPFGPGNLPNLLIAEQALARNKKVFLLDADLAERDYTPANEASVRIAAMLNNKASPFSHIAQLFALLEAT